jgi:uncharacterized iron-regulated membrane protein
MLPPAQNYDVAQDYRVQKKTAASLKFAKFSRKIHKWSGILLVLFAVTISISGGFIAFKSHLEYLQPSNKSGVAGEINAVISASKVVNIILALRLPEARQMTDINRIELRPNKRMYKVRLEAKDNWSSPREIQIDAITGAVLNIGLRGDQLWSDIHSFAVFGEFTKLFVMSMTGLSLLWLSLTGFYLFFYPIWFKAHKRQHPT